MMTCEGIHKERTKKILYRLTRANLSAMAGVLLFAAVLLFWGAGATAQTVQPLAVPAQFVRGLTPPGVQNNFVRPGRIISDNNFGEIYVADPGNNRITIFDQNGTFKYAFPVGAQCGAPLDLAVASDGIIYVLGSTGQGRSILKYDFDGLYLGSLDIAQISAESAPNITSIAIDAHDRLYAFDQAGGRIIRLSADGRFEFDFPVAANMNADDKDELVFGSLSISSDGNIYLPLASLGYVDCYDGNGLRLRSFGYQGNNLGELNFPISVAVTSDGIIMILDKHRFNVVCFAGNGKFLGEFGGKGISPGWFYHPTWLAVDDRDQVYIGQIFQNKVQVCSIPEFIHERQQEIIGNGSDGKMSSDPEASDKELKSKSMGALRGDYQPIMQVPSFASYNLQDFYLLSTQIPQAVWRFRNA